MTFGVKERKIFFIHDLFNDLQLSLKLDSFTVPEEPKELDKRRFNLEYLR